MSDRDGLELAERLVVDGISSSWRDILKIFERGKSTIGENEPRREGRSGGDKGLRGRWLVGKRRGIERFGAQRRRRVVAEGRKHRLRDPLALFPTPSVVPCTDVTIAGHLDTLQARDVVDGLEGLERLLRVVSVCSARVSPTTS